MYKKTQQVYTKAEVTLIHTPKQQVAVMHLLRWLPTAVEEEDEEHEEEEEEEEEEEVNIAKPVWRAQS